MPRVTRRAALGGLPAVGLGLGGAEAARARAGVDLSWRDGRLTRADVRAEKDGSHRFVHRGAELSRELGTGEPARLERRGARLVRV